ncbi:MAG: ABC transporter ATP-binding protein [Bryobacteraceae bacterium]
MSDAIITVEGLGKRYRLGASRSNERYTALRDVVAEAAAKPFRSLSGKFKSKNGASDPALNLNSSTSTRTSNDEEFWALKNVSFEVRQGEVVGIIGRNGAGKSTLLKILSRITDPTEGRVRIRGRVASLLEVGTGFHPELTGRENIYLNGAVLGMARSETKAKFDEIVAFAEVERFLDTPVKRYSSGMYVRLAFAVAAHLEPEILIVDEVLAVGDAEFQKKCLGKMDEVAHGGRTVLFVSHNMAVIQRLCRHGLLLERGKLLVEGPIEEVVGHYMHADLSQSPAGFNAGNRSGAGWARITDLRVVNEQGEPTTALPADADLIFEIALSITEQHKATNSLRGLVLELMFYNEQGQALTSLMNVDDGGAELTETQDCLVRARLAGPTFVPGIYRVRAFLGIPHLQHVDDIPDALTFKVLPPVHPWRPYDLAAVRGNMCRLARWETQS